MTLNPENYCIPRRHRLLGQTTKPTLATLSIKNLENICGPNSKKCSQYGIYSRKLFHNYSIICNKYEYDLSIIIFGKNKTENTNGLAKKHVTLSEKNIEENNGKNVTQLTFLSNFLILYPKRKRKRFPKITRNKFHQKPSNVLILDVAP